MLGHKLSLKRGSRDEAEKPFWISFADLMTALMVLFLVALAVALEQAENKAKEAEAERVKAVAAQVEANAERIKAIELAEQARKEKEAADRAKAELEEERKNRNNGELVRKKEINAFLNQLEKVTEQEPGVFLDRNKFVLDFGSRAQFGRGHHELTYDQAMAIRRLVPQMLDVIRTTGRNWLKRIVIEGFTDSTGDYLGNLDLSLKRSERVMCVLLAGDYGKPALPKAPAMPDALLVEDAPPPLRGVPPLSEDDERLMKEVFLVGGYSSNSQKASADESRRIELRMEFYAFNEPRSPPAQESAAQIGKCRLGVR